MGMLDTDDDGRSLVPRHVFLPMADESGGWARLARNVKAEIDAAARAERVGASQDPSTAASAGGRGPSRTASDLADLLNSAAHHPEAPKG
jgi:hypothetical protein